MGPEKAILSSAISISKFSRLIHHPKAKAVQTLTRVPRPSFAVGMSARLLRRVLQEREAAPQDTDGADDDQPAEEEASPPRSSARNLFDLLDDGNGDSDGDEEDKKVRAFRSLMIISLGFIVVRL